MNKHERGFEDRESRRIQKHSLVKSVGARGLLVGFVGACWTFPASVALAQPEEVPAAEPPAPPAEATPPPAETPVEAAPIAPEAPPEPLAEEPPPPPAEMAIETEPTADTAPVEEEAVAAETAEFPSDLHIGMGLRTGLALTFDNPAADGASLALTDGVGNEINARPYFSGQLTEAVGFTVNLEMTQSRDSEDAQRSVDILDAIVQLKVVDEFQIWFGQHIPAMERNNFNGPFYNNGWNLPILVHTLPFDIAGRDRGVTFWGLVADGILKYHLSVVDLDGPAATDTVEGAGLENARVAARATINLLDPENYYYTSGTYYGAQDTLALGLVYQAQKGVDAPDGSDPDNDLSAFTADLLFEKNLDEAGTITLEGGYWNFKGTGADYEPNQGLRSAGSGVALPGGSSSYLVGVSWLTPEKVGYGKIQPLAKLQMVDGDGSSPFALDVGVGYIIDDFNHRWFLNFRHQDSDEDGVDPINMLQMGAQLQL